MLPYGSADQKDAGKSRPLICLGNNGDRQGRARKGSIATCSAEWITTLADIFKEEFSFDKEVAINNPFSGGFISNAHFWHKGIPWIQIEINRSLYEPDGSICHTLKRVQRSRYPAPGKDLECFNLLLEQVQIMQPDYRSHRVMKNFYSGI